MGTVDGTHTYDVPYTLVVCGKVPVRARSPEEADRRVNGAEFKELFGDGARDPVSLMTGDPVATNRKPVLVAKGCER